jgi:acyl-CoA thioester hydrolase
MREFHYEIHVPYAHVDQMRFVYYANYLVYFEMARSDLLRKAGLPYSLMEERGLMLPVIAAHCEYRNAARFDDLLDIVSRCTAWRGPRLHIEYEVFRRATAAGPVADDDPARLVCTGYTEHVCMSTDGKAMRPAPELKALVE